MAADFPLELEIGLCSRLYLFQRKANIIYIIIYFHLCHMSYVTFTKGVADDCTLQYTGLYLTLPHCTAPHFTVLNCTILPWTTIK